MKMEKGSQMMLHAPSQTESATPIRNNTGHTPPHMSTLPGQFRLMNELVDIFSPILNAPDDPDGLVGKDNVLMEVWSDSLLEDGWDFDDD